MTQCPHCGETSYYPAGPHSSRPCPVLQREHEKRVALLEAQLVESPSAVTTARSRSHARGRVDVRLGPFTARMEIRERRAVVVLTDYHGAESELQSGHEFFIETAIDFGAEST